MDILLNLAIFYGNVQQKERKKEVKVEMGVKGKEEEDERSEDRDKKKNGGGEEDEEL